MFVTATKLPLYIVLALCLGLAECKNPERCGIVTDTGEVFNTKCHIEGDCCSAYGYCDSDPPHCNICQKDFGYCPRLCDANTYFCGPASLSTFVLAVVAAVISVVAAITGIIALVVKRVSAKKDNGPARGPRVWIEVV